MNTSRLILAAACALVFVASPAMADDSGDEYCIPITRWKCWGCGMEVFTFDPDDIGANSGSKKNNIFRKHQESNWVMLHSGSPIPKCDEFSDGAHLFDVVDDVVAAPPTIHKWIKQFVVLKDGGTLKAKIRTTRCIYMQDGCSRPYYTFFSCDDADMYGTIHLKETGKVYNIASGKRISSCKSIVMGELRWEYHFLIDHDSSPREIKSIDLVKMIHEIWFSS